MLMWNKLFSVSEVHESIKNYFDFAAYHDSQQGT